MWSAQGWHWSGHLLSSMHKCREFPVFAMHAAATMKSPAAATRRAFFLEVVNEIAHSSIVTASMYTIKFLNLWETGSFGLHVGCTSRELCWDTKILVTLPDVLWITAIRAPATMHPAFAPFSGDFCRDAKLVRSVFRARPCQFRHIHD